MLSTAAISEAAISALPDRSLLTFAATATLEGSMVVFARLKLVSEFGERPIFATEIETMQTLPAGTSGIFIYAATKEFISYATDDLPNQPFLGTLQKPVVFERSVIAGAGFGEIRVGYGELELINTGGDYDDLIGTYAVDGRQVVLRAGSIVNGVVADYNDFALVTELTATGWVINEDRLIVLLRDNTFRLEVPTQPNLYGGGGDVDGPSDLAGKRKPIAVGQVRNISPPLLIPGRLVYQVHDGSIEAIDAVYDSGSELVNSGDHANAAALFAAAISSGFATCLAEGLFMLGAAPAGKITADVRGDNSGGYIETTSDIVKFLVLNATDLTEVDDLDIETFDMLNVEQPAPIGYFLDVESNETVIETTSKLMAGIGGWVGFDYIGRLEVRRVKAPTTVAVERYDEFDLLTLTRDRLPTGIDPIIKRARVAYDRNWTVQEGTELTGEVTENDPDLVSYLASQFRVTSTTDSGVEFYHPLAIDPDPVEAFFVNEEDAADEALSRVELYGVERSMYRFAVKEHLFAQDVGDTVFLTAPRLGLDDGIYLIVVEVRDDLESMTTEIVGFG
jgi:hypothetical protein